MQVCDKRSPHKTGVLPEKLNLWLLSIARKFHVFGILFQMKKIGTVSQKTKQPINWFLYE